MIVASRLTSTGTLFISGEFDEVTTSTIRLTTTSFYAAFLDEVTMNGNSVAKRETNTGTVMVSNGFDEINKPV